MNALTRFSASLTTWSSLKRNAHMPKPYQLSLQHKYLEQIQSGQKTVEGRVATPRFKSIHPGDHIQFFSSEDKNYSLLCKVLSIGRYESFRQMLEKEGLEKCLPGVQTLEKGEEIYHQFPNYKANAKRYGVRAIRIEIEKGSL